MCIEETMAKAWETHTEEEEISGIDGAVSGWAL